MLHSSFTTTHFFNNVLLTLKAVLAELCSSYLQLHFVQILHWIFFCSFYYTFRQIWEAFDLSFSAEAVCLCCRASVCWHVDRSLWECFSSAFTEPSFFHQCLCPSVGSKYQNGCFKLWHDSRPLYFTFNVKCFKQEIYKPHKKQIVSLKTFTSKMMKMPFWFIYLIFLYIFLQNKKKTKNKS